ncbi:uncharacterized protein EI90DRAFT_1387226 [Cantharellus anzutake]|uniref:uncharacterized protein n=1 Tax=Cantharellus anzutake TaxID=1750568 RepID=UPI001908E86F|nr:uncharacterized protein EI90DRAFT_1387226 [Cantharellus anzutake]KAF8329387.1 hypothetical protein EI90DRAFT_1387226 [Cantharellus anzutake]
MHKPKQGTAWSKNSTSTSSIISSAKVSSKPSQKGKSSTVQKSKDVRRVERLLKSLNTGLAPSDVSNDGCFCQAKVHRLSSYVPICPHCGLIFCLLQHPANPCPFCHLPLLSPHTKNALVQKLNFGLSVILQKEADAEEARARQAQSNITAFPPLTSTSPSGVKSTSSSPSASRRVVSVKAGKARISVTPSPGQSTPANNSDAEKDEFSNNAVPPRVPLPPDDPPFVPRRGNERRWQNLHGEGLTYVESQLSNEIEQRKMTTSVKENS